MSFANAELLWLLLVIPPGLIAFFWWSRRRRDELMRRFIAARLLPALLAGVSPLRYRFKAGLLVLASTCLIIALARPQWGFSWQEVKQRGVDIVVAIDCSKSMLATDITPNRLARAKLAALELMQKARTDRLGLVAFAGSAFLACPLTIDDAAFGQSVDSLDVNTISQGGTALAGAIETSLTAFKEGDNHKVLVLMTDGEDHDPGAVEAATAAAQAGLRIYTVGIGTAEGELMRVADEQGRVDYVRDEQGNVVKSRLNEKLLNEIAGSTEGGFYLPLRGARTIETLYERGLATLPKSEHQEKLVKQYHPRYHWPLAAAILLLIAEVLLPPRGGTQSRARPIQASAASALTGPATALLALFLASTAGAASPGRALREYRAGNYDQALKDYEQLLQRKSDDPRLRFNAGAAAYRNGQYDEATKQFDRALSTPDLQLQESAYYNRGNSLFWLGEQSPDPNQRKQSWERALKDFELSMKLDPTDADAKFNHDFVRKRLEELKQQQQQNDSPQDKSDQQNQDQQPQGDSSKQDQDKQQQQQQQQDQQQTQKERQDQAQQPQQSGDQEQQQQAQQQRQSSPKENDQQQQQSQPLGDSKGQKEQQEKETQAAAAGQMTPEQARQLLDSQKGQEKMLSQKLQKPLDRTRRFKDW
jgi:Ca-activated chloride channel homolog